MPSPFINTIKAHEFPAPDLSPTSSISAHLLPNRAVIETGPDTPDVRATRRGTELAPAGCQVPKDSDPIKNRVVA
jgi:hypothetical protein